VVVGLSDVVQNTSAAGFFASSFSIFEPRYQAPRHSSMSLWNTGDATIWASSKVALKGTFQWTLPVGGSNDTMLSAVHTISCRQPPAVMTMGALYAGRSLSAFHFSSPVFRSNAITHPSGAPATTMSRSPSTSGAALAP